MTLGRFEPVRAFTFRSVVQRGTNKPAIAVAETTAALCILYDTFVNVINIYDTLVNVINLGFALAPRILVSTPSTRERVKNDPPKYLKNDKRYKPETFGGVRGMLHVLKKFEVDITVFAW